MATIIAMVGEMNPRLDSFTSDELAEELRDWGWEFVGRNQNDDSVIDAILDAMVSVLRGEDGALLEKARESKELRRFIAVLKMAEDISRGR